MTTRLVLDHACFLAGYPSEIPFVATPSVEPTPPVLVLQPTIPARVEREERYYRPLTFFRNYDMFSEALPPGLMYDQKEGRLVVLEYISGKRLYDPSYFVRIDENPLAILCETLQTIHHPSAVFSRDLREVLSHTDCEQFIRSICESNHWIFSLKPFVIQEILKIAQERKIKINLRHKNPPSEQTLLNTCLKDPLLAKQHIEMLCAVDPALMREDACEEVLFTQKQKVIRLFLEVLEDKQIVLSPKMKLFGYIALDQHAMTPEELESLKMDIGAYSRADQRMIYRLANIHSHVSIVRVMNELGWGVKEPRLWSHSPSIFAADMDAAQMRNSVLMALKRMMVKRSAFKEEGYRRKWNRFGEADFGRVLGALFFERNVFQIAQEMGIKELTVGAPKKVIVIDDDAFPLIIDCGIDLRQKECQNLRCTSKKLALYVEEIEPFDRRPTDNEMTLLLRSVRLAEYWDLHNENVMVTETGLRVIDTEMKNYRGVGSDCFGQYDQLNGEGDFWKARGTVFDIAPRQSLYEIIDGWEQDWAQNRQQRIEERRTRLVIETAALQESGCIGGCTFVFTEGELFPRVVQS
jgi:hypothetical protein